MGNKKREEYGIMTEKRNVKVKQEERKYARERTERNLEESIKPKKKRAD